MLIQGGETKLKEFSDATYPLELVQVNDRVLFIAGLGASNCIAVEGDTSLILIDALDSSVRGEKLKQLLAQRTDKPVKTILFTHGHPDHRGGSGAFRGVAEEVVMMAPRKPALKHYDRIQQILNKRIARQFGYALSNDACISQGISIREGRAVGEGDYDFLPPTTVCQEPVVERVIDGVRLQLVSVPGETDDQMMVWLEDDKVLCCGDNYYGCFPNLYALRGSQYRDIAAWVESLDTLLTYPAEVLLPGHSRAVFGHDAIQDVIGHYRDAIEAILFQTLDCMEQGMTMSECVEHVRLPEPLRSLPYFQEFYGTLEWSVKGIYAGYVGWFDGNPTNLHPLPDRAFDAKLVALLTPETVLSQVKTALEQSEYQYAVQLCDMLLNAQLHVAEAKALKADGLQALASLETSANGRNYYLVSAKELRGEL